MCFNTFLKYVLMVVPDSKYDVENYDTISESMAEEYVKNGYAKEITFPNIPDGWEHIKFITNEYHSANWCTSKELEEAIKAGDSDKAATIQAAIDEGQRQAGVPIPLELLIAVSLGSVFMGAMTYIGNGPHFMVKAIAEENGVKMPSFFGYMGYSVCILLPILIVMTVIFL